MVAQNKARIKVNRAVAHFMAQIGAFMVSHKDLELGTGDFWQANEMNAIGIDIWNLAFQGGIEIAVRMWWNAWA